MPNTSFQRTLTRGGFGPLNSDRKAESGQERCKGHGSLQHRETQYRGIC